MKKILFFLLAFVWMASVSAQDVLYVKQNATGTNNGSSWANAFTSLELALDAAAVGDEIWVSSGTYVPAGSQLDVSFNLAEGVKLYGGFAGTETALSQRNIGANETILSGDVNGDDLDNDLSVNKTDNRLHVLLINGSASVTNPAIVDGFTIKGGYTSVNSADPLTARRGAGIYTTGKLTVRNCNFNNNRAEDGAGIMAPNTDANGLVVYNCIFQKSATTARGTGLYFINLDGVTIRKCSFSDNITSRGCIYPRSSTNVVVDSCIISNNSNVASDGFGTGMFVWQCNIAISNSQFIGNQAGSAVSMYLDNREGGRYATIHNCLFENNTSTNYGGCGIHSYRQNYLATNCTFKDNLAPSSAAAIYNSDTLTFEVRDCHFEGNSANYAGAVANYGENCVGTFKDCTFKGNTATQGGGAVSNGFKANVAFEDCLFEANMANFGAAIFTQNDTTRLTVRGCTFTENAAQSEGGCIFQNENIKVDIENATFKINSANIGAAIYASGDSAMTIKNSVFVDNLSVSQAAGLYVLNGNLEMQNCLMARNLNISADGAAGAIGNNASGTGTSRVFLQNCTIADNFAPLGAGISQWQESDSSSAQLTLQNCLLQNPDGANYTIEDGSPIAVSGDGNQSADASLSGILTSPKDLENTANSFVDPSIGDYHLLVGPALDGGVENDLDADLEGKAHEGLPDVGCYELGTNNTWFAPLKVLPMTLFPNPAHDVTRIMLENTVNGSGLLQIIGLDGKLYLSKVVEKNTTNWQYELPVANLANGQYMAKLRIGEHQFVGSFSKQ